jgi:molybdate transport system substrate-binding protein
MIHDMTAPALRLVSSMATREVLRELAAAFSARSGHAVTTEAGGGVDVARRVREGEAFDVVALADNVIDKLIGEGRLVAPRTDLVRSGVAVAVPAGAARPPLATDDDVRAAVLAAPSLSYSTGPSGTYLEGLFQRWGILDTIRPRIVVPPPGVPVGSLVASGQAQLGFQQLSELLNVPGIQVLGPLPPTLQTVTVFSAAVSAQCAHSDVAAALLQFMASAEVAAVKQRHGMDGA